ncbi:MAG: hypothetical protein L6Q95_17785 [Planctomycetes bacterium]|nr:hypothetical protein [Planctomycetota bacterium]
MQRRGLVPCALLSCLAVAGVVAFAKDVMVPETTEMKGAGKILLSFGGGGEDAPAFLARSLDGEEQRATFPLPAEGIADWKLALVARTDKGGAITGFSLVTWKQAEKKPEREWPELKAVEGAEARIRGSQTLLFRQLPAEGKGSKWSFEIVSFRRIEPKEDEDPVVRARKEILEEEGARLIEDRRYTLVAPATPTEKTFCGILLVPAWKEEGKALEGFDARLVTTPAPEEARE